MTIHKRNKLIANRAKQGIPIDHLSWEFKINAPEVNKIVINGLIEEIRKLDFEKKLLREQSKIAQNSFLSIQFIMNRPQLLLKTTKA